MRIVHIVTHDFRPPDSGGRIKTSALASALASCGELHVLDMGKRPQQSQAKTMTALPFGGAAHYHALLPWASAHRMPPALLRSWKLLRLRAARILVGRLAPDVVVADDISCAGVGHAARRPRWVVHTHNVESALHREMAAQSRRRADLRKAQDYERLERRALSRADQVWCVRDADAEHYRSIGCRDVLVVPNVVPDSFFHGAAVVGERGRALYFGSLWWRPNADAAREFAGIAARLYARGRQYRFVVAGHGAGRELQAELAAAPMVECVGFLPSLQEEARRAAAIVIPLAWGGGTKVKTLAALALGKPVVTTPEGAAGLDLRDGLHALVRPLGEAFDRAVVDVLERPAAFSAMAEAGQNHVREHYSCAAIQQAVQGALAKLSAHETVGAADLPMKAPTLP